MAQVVCETMNNYLMFDKLLKCEMLPPEKASRACFRDKVDPLAPPGKKARAEAKRAVNALKTEKQNNKRLRKQLCGLERLKKKLESHGLRAEVDLGASLRLPTGASPVMEVDVDEDEVMMKTPPNVRKVKSRGNSLAGSLASSTAASKAATPKAASGKKKAVGLQQKMMAEAVSKKLLGSASKKKKDEGRRSSLKKSLKKQ